MITKQHTLVTYLAFVQKGKSVEDFKRAIPWVLLPDAIRMYSGPRPLSHFEATPSGNGTAWMEFPNAETLEILTKENFKDNVAMYMPDIGFPKCVIGEETQIDVFDSHNYWHPHFSDIRMHLQQDVVLDKVVRELVDTTKRFSDIFTVNWNSKKIDGNALRKQVAEFENIGFVYLATKVYAATGTLITQQWFEEMVLSPLLQTYSAELTRNTFKYMEVTEEEEIMIRRLITHRTSLETEKWPFCESKETFIATLDRMYSEAIVKTMAEL